MSIEYKEGRKKPYLVCVRDCNGQFYPRKAFRTKTDAKVYESSCIARKTTGQVALSKELKDLQFGTFVDLWMAEANKASDGWRISQGEMFRNHVQPEIGDRKLIDIKPNDILRILNTMEAKTLSNQTRLHVYNFLNKIFKDASSIYEVQIVNPVLVKFKPAIREKEQKFLKAGEAQKLFEFVKDTDIGLAVALGLFCAMRISEIQALRVNSVDMVNHEITIQSAFQKKTKKIQDYPKQGDFGKTVIPQSIRCYLYNAIAAKQPNDFVVSPNNKMLNYYYFLKKLKRSCLAINVPLITTHGQRHSATEIYINEGASQEDIRRLLNHSSLSSTQRYIHRTDSRLKNFANNI